jgi:hypothetical protein
VGIVTTIFALFIFFVSIQFSLGLARAEQEKVQASLNPYQKKIAQARLLKDRLTQIKKVRDEREMALSKIDTIISKKPQGIQTDSLEVADEDIEITFSSPSLSPINDFLESLVELKASDLFKEIKVVELKLAPSGGYELVLLIK